MASIHETAYPRLKSSVSLRDLKEVYTPTSAELALAQSVARSNSSRVCFLVMLKTFQRLGYFVQVCDVPKSIIQHIKHHAGITATLDSDGYDESGTRRQHVPIIREFTGVKTFDSGAKSAMLDIMCQAAQTKNDLCDIINVAIEELVRLSFELPAFTTFVKAARRARSKVNQAIYDRVVSELQLSDKEAIDNLLIVQPGEKRSTWDTLRTDPGKPSLKQLRQLIVHLQQLKRTNAAALTLSTVADGKLRQFAAEAKSLDAARVQEVVPNKRYTIVSALIKLQLARRLDDLGDMLIKRMHKVHTKGKEALL